MKTDNCLTQYCNKQDRKVQEPTIWQLTTSPVAHIRARLDIYFANNRQPREHTMKFRFQQHTFEVQDRIAWAITKLSGRGMISVYNGNNHIFTASVESHNFQTKETNGEIEIEAIEIFGTKNLAAQDHDTGDTLNNLDYSPRVSLWNRTTKTTLDILGDSALSIMGYPQDRRLKIDSTEYEIEFTSLIVHVANDSRFNPVQLLGTIERV